MSSIRNFVFSMAVALISISAGHATILTTTLNKVVIGTHTYDVIFSQDSSGLTSFNDVFGAGSPVLTFTTEADALAAANALRAAADALNFDMTPGGSFNVFFLPFAFTAANFSWFAGWSDDPQFDGVFGPATTTRTDNLLAGSYATFAQIPEPATLALLGLGLAVVAFSRQRKQ